MSEGQDTVANVEVHGVHYEAEDAREERQRDQLATARTRSRSARSALPWPFTTGRCERYGDGPSCQWMI